jgi:hypothetical protein
MQLYEALSMHVAAWREEGYKHDNYPVLENTSQLNAVMAIVEQAYQQTV